MSAAYQNQTTARKIFKKIISDFSLACLFCGIDDLPLMRKPLTGHTNGICKKEAKESKRATLQTLHSLGGFRRLVGRNTLYIIYSTFY